MTYDISTGIKQHAWQHRRYKHDSNPSSNGPFFSFTETFSHFVVVSISRRYSHMRFSAKSKPYSYIVNTLSGPRWISKKFGDTSFVTLQKINRLEIYLKSTEGHACASFNYLYTSKYYGHVYNFSGGQIHYQGGEA